MTTIHGAKGANAGRARSHNRQLVLGHIHAQGQTGRAQIGRLSGLSTQAASNIISDLLEDGLLCEVGRQAKGRGLPAILYDIDPDGGYAFGFEVRPNAVFASLLNLKGETLYTQHQRVELATPEIITTLVKQLFTEAITQTKINRDKVLGAGIVMPGPFGVTQLSSMATSLPQWQQIDAKSLFSQALNLEVIVENDANASALAERVSGAAKGLSNYAYIYFGAGVGLGMLNEGALVRGAFGNAGEIGYIPINTPKGLQLLEECASRLSLEKTLAAAGKPVQEASELSALYQAKDKGVLDWIAQTISPLSQAISIVENLCDPQSIILGGAMPEDILEHIISQIEFTKISVSNRPHQDTPRLSCGNCGGMTAALGAAALVLNKQFTPQIAVRNSSN